jgi:hypothetical protein
VIDLKGGLPNPHKLSMWKITRRKPPGDPSRLGFFKNPKVTSKLDEFGWEELRDPQDSVSVINGGELHRI